MHIPLNKVKVIAEVSNGRVQISWNLDKLDESEYMYSPYSNSPVHHYHRDQLNRLLCDKEHDAQIPGVETGLSSVSAEHESCYSECKREGDYFTHDTISI